MGRVSMITALLVLLSALCAAGLIGWIAGSVFWALAAFGAMVGLAYLIADEPLPQDLASTPVSRREV